MSADLILSRLEGVRQVGPERWFAKCPVHADKRASLLVTPKDDGKVTAYCFGCGAKGLDIVRALGLSSDALFPPKDIYRQQGGRHRLQPPMRPLRRHYDFDLCGYGLPGHVLWTTAVEWDLKTEYQAVRWMVERQRLYERHGPTLRPHAKLTSAPAWAIAARDAR